MLSVDLLNGHCLVKAMGGLSCANYSLSCQEAGIHSVL